MNINTMPKPNDLVSVKVSFPAWADAAKSWHLLTVRSENGRAWSGGGWFPKRACSLQESPHEKGVGFLTLPFWLLSAKLKEGVKFTNLNNTIIQ